ncbi:hypothetical protein V8F20_002749 [Naviculisporaceae sp. PSN 640]
MSGSMSTSPASSQPGRVDNIDSLLDLSEYDSNPFSSPSLSPEVSNKATFARPVKTEVNTPSLLSSGPQLTGPSHQYDLYKQQTGIVPGALATTFAVNQNNALIHGYGSYGLGGYLDMSATDELFDFNTAPSQASITSPDLENMDFDSPSTDPNFFFGEATVNPSVIGGQEPSSLPSPPGMSTSNVGRLWPGMHQQAAMAKAQQQQQQQRQKAQQQQAKQNPRQKSPSDPIVEQKITQLLNSMRAKASVEDDGQATPVLNVPRPRKDEEDMDEDERLLASEEGKKLSSKERRQLRNKVSARAFRSRRKEYITQLESEIANKVTENGDLRAKNRALVEENKRLSDLTKMLLSSTAFSSFLDQLSQNPEQLAPAQPQPQQPQQQEQARQLPKDVNPYAAQQQMQHQQIGLAMIPEQTMDYSMLSLEPMDGFNYQPQVYTAVIDEQPTIDTSVFSGKTSNFVGPAEDFDSDEDKVEMPVISERPTATAPAKKEEAPVLATPVIDEEFESDPAFALYHESTTTASSTEPAAVEFDMEGLSNIDIFGGIAPEKAFARYELVDATEDEATAALAMARVQRISANLEGVVARLESLTMDY